MAQVRLDIQSLVVTNGPVASLVVLKPRSEDDSSTVKLPIRIGTFEAACISMGIDTSKRMKRPMSHDLMGSIIQGLGAKLTRVVITHVEDTTFYAQLTLTTETGQTVFLDARPSDAIALAVRVHAPIFAEDRVLEAATLPDFESVEREAAEDERAREEEAFHQFVEGLSPEDFAV
ncbi:MAG: bifunctional nuclease family protein [Atopobiaceae bacterium]|nr:bifunctional nuclease family protein [Atopobiaceae bacterium]